LLKCGKDGYKISKGQPLLDKEGNKVVAYICPHRNPMKYYVLKDSSGKVVKSAIEENKCNLTPNKDAGETVELFSYAGCPHWNKPDTKRDDFFD